MVICYDMVFPKVANTLVKKGAQVLISPSRIVRRGIEPWQMYVQVRALENRIPILSCKCRKSRFGGNSIIVDLTENNKIVTTKITKLNVKRVKLQRIQLDKYEKSRKTDFQIQINFND